MPLTKEDADALLDGVCRLAIVGVAKNCGKTTTLNALLAHLANKPVGLLSIGIDGEPEDMLVGTPKPSIIVREGHHVITAQGALESSSARVEYVASLGFSTPMGEVVLAKVRDPGAVLLAGLRHRGDLLAGLELLESHGVEATLIDGAYGRTMAAHADISDGFILSTGAILSSSVEEIVAHTMMLVDSLTLPQPNQPWQQRLLEQTLEEQRALLGTPSGEVQALPMNSALLGLSRGRHLWTKQYTAIAIPGLVSDRVIEELLALDDTPRTLLVADGTALKASRKLVERLRNQWEIRAMARSNLRAISYNPTSIAGLGVDAESLARALREQLSQRGVDARVFDPEK
jgi:hypothetical protein